MDVLLLLSVIFSLMELVAITVILGIAIWFIKQIAMLGQPKLLISQPRPKALPAQSPSK